MRSVIVADHLTPVVAYALLRDASDGRPSFLLESAPIGGERWGRYSIVGFRPTRVSVLELRQGPEISTLYATISHTFGAVREESMAFAGGDVATALRWMARDNQRPEVEGLPRVVDAPVGYVAYDLVHALAPVKGFAAQGERPLRLAHFVDDATLVVFDALLQTVTVYGDREHDVHAAIDILQRGGNIPPLRLPSRDRRAVSESSLSDAAYVSRVQQAKEYIRAGDVFQVVLARKFLVPRLADRGDAFQAYRAMRVLNPSPYLYFLDLGRSVTGDVEVIAGASPETLVRLEDGIITVRPLAGTRPRGASVDEDAAFERELRSDPKELAEHVMLIDLARNDVGRVSQVGSVRVPVQFAVERYSHVMHLVSEVQGRLTPNRDPWDVLAATFPAGTLSGAPKIRAMQIIRELEDSPRGIYGGAVGYASRHGTLDMAIAIRTIVGYRDHFEVGAGAGVVEASDPTLEAEETRHKASAALAALASVGE